MSTNCLVQFGHSCIPLAEWCSNHWESVGKKLEVNNNYTNLEEKCKCYCSPIVEIAKRALVALGLAIISIPCYLLAGLGMLAMIATPRDRSDSTAHWKGYFRVRVTPDRTYHLPITIPNKAGRWCSAQWKNLGRSLNRSSFCSIIGDLAKRALKIVGLIFLSLPLYLYAGIGMVIERFSKVDQRRIYSTATYTDAQQITHTWEMHLFRVLPQQTYLEQLIDDESAITLLKNKLATRSRSAFTHQARLATVLWDVSFDFLQLHELARMNRTSKMFAVLGSKSISRRFSSLMAELGKCLLKQIVKSTTGILEREYESYKFFGRVTLGYNTRPQDKITLWLENHKLTLEVYYPFLPLQIAALVQTCQAAKDPSLGYHLIDYISGYA